MLQIKNRIVGHGDVSPSEILENKKNWRIHPEEQQKGMETILDKVGWVQSVIVNKRTNTLVDGHLRVSLAVKRNEPTVPVVFVDLTDEEESIILSTLDPIGDLAVFDQSMIRSLLEGVDKSGIEGLLDSIGFAFSDEKKPKSVDLRPFTKHHVLVTMHEGCDIAAVSEAIKSIEQYENVEVIRASN